METQDLTIPLWIETGLATIAGEAKIRGDSELGEAMLVLYERLLEYREGLRRQVIQ